MEQELSGGIILKIRQTSRETDRLIDIDEKKRKVNSPELKPITFCVVLQCSLN